MALTNAEKQARWRARRDALVRANPEALERLLVEDAERCERMSDQERTVLADKLTDIAMRHLWRAHALFRIAAKGRTGGREGRAGGGLWAEESARLAAVRS